MPFDLEKTIDFYYRSNYATFDEYLQNPYFYTAFSDNIKDIDCNHLVPIGTSSPRELLSLHREIFSKRSRKPAICITPLSSSYGQAFPDLARGATDIWMTFEGKVPKVSETSELKARLIDATEEDAFIYTFENSFQDGVYGKLPKEYYQVERLFFAPRPGFTPLMALCYHNGKPIGCVMSIIEKEMAFIYSLGIIKEHRMGGLPAKMIGDFIIRKSFDYGAKNLFLQTEYKSPLERLYLKSGFTPLFTGSYYLDPKQGA